MGKQAKARRKREGWGFTSKRFRPVTAPDTDSEDDDAPPLDAAAIAAKAKRKATAIACPATKRRRERETRELKIFVGKRGVAVKRDDAAAAAGSDINTLPALDWATEYLAPFTRAFWPEGNGWTRGGAAEDGEVVSAECKKARKSIGVVVRGAAVPPPIMTVTDKRLPKQIRTYIKKVTAFERPTSVQAQAWPAVLSGADVVAVAPTGTGKTLA